jgi:hypothetical protein
MPPVEFEPTIPASARPRTYGLGWVHTFNVTACRNAVTLQVANAVQSYELNLHPVTVRRNSNHHAQHCEVPSLLREPK